jgi:hypothetical protein
MVPYYRSLAVAPRIHSMLAWDFQSLHKVQENIRVVSLIVVSKCHTLILNLNVDIHHTKSNKEMLKCVGRLMHSAKRLNHIYFPPHIVGVGLLLQSLIQVDSDAIISLHFEASLTIEKHILLVLQ